MQELIGVLRDTPPKRILITGGQGMLGHAFHSQIQKHMPHVEVLALGRDELDVRKKDQLTKWADWLNGGWLLHCAALVNVDGCAREPEMARQVIVDGVKNALELALMSEAQFFYPQSFLAFDGRENPIPEDEERRPLSLYGELKKEAEELVMSAPKESLRVVMAGFFGGEKRDKNFVGKIIPHLANLIRSGQKSIAIGDRVWQPTLTDDLALNSLVLMALGRKGSYQMSCKGEATFAELAQAIIDCLDWSEFISVSPVSATQVAKNELGARPARAVLSCTRLNAENLNMQSYWLESLKAYLARPYFSSFRELERPHLERVVEI